MSSALQLTATATILNGNGLAPNVALSNAISSFGSLPTISYTANVFSAAASTLDSGDAYLGTVLSNLGVGVSNNVLWLLDYYPSNASPVCSTSLGYIFQSNVISSIANIGNLAGVSRTLSSQAAAPFTYSLAGFANVFSASYAHASSVFDTAGSIYILQNKTYGDSGIGYAGASDLATYGIGSSSNLVAQTVSTWGTMYDASKPNLIGDPYVFGQNLLNQGLGSYGNLSAKLTAAGLDVTDITSIPPTTTTTTQTASSLSVNSIVGTTLLPVTQNVTTTTTVQANSPDVVLAIYKTITGSDLAEIVAATGTTIVPNFSITTLADYLDFSKVIPANLQSKYSTLNISSLNQLGSYIYNIIGSSNLATWQDIANVLVQIQVPVFSANTTTSASSAILSNSTISTLQSFTGTGSGPLNNLIMSDFLGATAGMPYTALINNLIAEYKAIAPTAVESALLTLVGAINTYATTLTGNKHLLVAGLNADVAAVNSALNALGNTVAVNQAASSYYTILNKLANEVNNLNIAGATISPAPNNILLNFSQNLGSIFSDSTQTQTYQVSANLITNDQYGDTIRAVIAESSNGQTLLQYGINQSNDAAPAQAIAGAQAQNIPISTYLSQNK